MKTIVLTPRQICDLELLLNGAFAPVGSYMGELDYHSVLDNLRLTSGEVFPLPVTLSVDEEVRAGESIKLVDQCNYPLASLIVKEAYRPDVEKECTAVYGCCDDNHPYIKETLKKRDHFYISGKLTKENGVTHFDYNDLRRTPAEVKQIFKDRGWTKVVAFQTRNPMHRSHVELTKSALKEVGDDCKLLLHPVVGVTQECDVDYHTRIHCYKKLVKHYPPGQMELSLLNLSMRMAGPREALLHGIVRRNHGCTHFIVGRDHAGPSYKKKDGTSFFGPYEAQDMFIKYGKEVGIELVKFKMISYVANKGIYLPADKITKDMVVKHISGTQQREMLRKGEKIPEWFTFPEIADLLKKKYDKQRQRGTCIYLTGLSGSGKTTIANHLKTRLLEEDFTREITILDGDVIRQNLSKGLGFSRADRSTNVRRIGYVAAEIVRHKGTVICANIAPYDDDRLHNRKEIGKYGKYIEVHVDPGLAVCEDRDVKGLYKMAREGTISQFTGISDPFEESSDLDLRISGIDLQERH